MPSEEMPERIWLDADSYNGAVGFAHPEKHKRDGWPAYIRSDLCASGQQVRAMMDAAPKRIARIIRENLSGVTSTEADIRSAQEDDLMRTAELIVADLCALTPAPQPEGMECPRCASVGGFGCYECTPPQPSETVAACETVLICAQEMCKAGHPVSAFNVATDALRALKGEV